MTKSRLGALQVALAAISWSFAGALSKSLPWNSFTINGVRSLVAALLSNLEPILNPVWAFLLVGERPGRLTVVGAAIVLVAATVYALMPARDGE